MNDKQPVTQFRTFPLSFVLIFIVLSAGIVLCGYLYFQNTKEYIKKEKQNDLSAIADLKANQIAGWRNERLDDAAVIFENPIMVSNIYQWLEKGRSAELRGKLLKWMSSLQKHYDYKSVILLDSKGDIQLAVPDYREILGPDARKLAEEAIKAKKVVFSDIYRSKITHAIRITLVLPILIPKDKKTVPAGALLFRIDPYKFFYPIIQSWPTQSRSAETLLVHREGDEVVFINELRHVKDTALKLRFKITEEKLPAAIAARGIEGILEGIDYRGVPVLAALRAVPDSPWFMVAKVDRDEVYSPIHERLRLLIFILTALIISTGFGLVFVWRRKELELAKREEENIRKLNKELERSNKELEQFAYIASHDLQEPLRMVSSYLQLIAERYKGRLDADADDFIHYAVEGANRMQTMINDLLAYSRVGTRGRPFEPADCNTILEQALSNVKFPIEETGAVITHDPLPVLTADRSQLVQVFQNLISNAIKFRGERTPEIQISTEKKDGEWIFSVKDNGIGFDPKYADKIFDTFKRLHTAVKYPGSGIGLTICRKIIERHGGRIWSESEPGKGAIFYFTIPIKQ
jgi:signal transduction histidine kinase